MRTNSCELDHTSNALIKSDSRFRRALTPVAVVATLTVAGLIAARDRHLFIINETASVPKGLYVRVPKGTQLRRGDTVCVCLTDAEHQLYVRMGFDRGYLREDPMAGCVLPAGLGRIAPLVKRIVAVPGDEVSIHSLKSSSASALMPGVYVNGAKVPGSEPLERDGLGRELPQLAMQGRLPPGHYLVMGDEQAPKSFDSRYFGAIPEGDVVARMERL